MSEGDSIFEGARLFISLLITSNVDYGVLVVGFVVEPLAELHKPILDRMLASLEIFPPAEAMAALTTLPREVAPLIPRDILFGLPDRRDVRLSPDGTRISYLAPVCGRFLCVMNVWVGPVEDLPAAEPVTHETENGVHGYFWAYTDDHILYTQYTDGDENWRLYSVNLASGQTVELTPSEGVQARVQELSPRFPGEILVGLNDRDAELHDIYRVNIETGERSLVTVNDGFTGFTTDDDFSIRFATRITPEGGQDILQSDGEGGWVPFLSVTIKDALTTALIGFDKSGESLYMVESRGRNTSALAAISLETGEETVIVEDPLADLSDWMIHPTEKYVQAAAFKYERKSWVILDESIRSDFAYLRTVADGDFDVISRSLDDEQWIVAYLVADGPSRYYHYDREERIAQFLFTTSKLLEGLAFANMSPVIIESRDGFDLVSYLTLPTGMDPDGDARPDTPLPMVMLVHGGPWARDEWGFNLEHQWLANRGYAVLSVNFRGSTGFGKEFVNVANMEWGGKMHDDLIDAVEWAVDERIAEPDRIAIMGSSYGGYATLVGLTFTPETFACGVEFAGASNLVTDLSTIPPYWEPFIELFATRVGDHRTEEGRRFLTERSPLTHVDRIERPLLIGQGSNDPRVKQAESDQIVQAMRENGIPVTYLRYLDEGHGFTSAGNAQSFNAVVEVFLAECLGGRYELIGDALEFSSMTVPVGAEHIPGLLETLSFGPFASYESDQYAFSIQFPAGWTEEQPDPALGIVATYAGDEGGVLAIAEEDLVAFGLGESTLDEYVEIILSVLRSGVQDLEVLSSVRKTNSQGLPVQIMQYTGNGGLFRFSRLVYLHEGRIGFNATYFAFQSRHQELEDMIDYSFSTFRVQ